MESQSKRFGISYRRLETEDLELNEDEGYDDEEIFDAEQKRLIFGIRKKSRRWVTFVGGVVVVVIISLTTGLIIWQTQKSDSNDKEPEIPEIPEVGYGEYQHAAVSCDAPLCSEIGKTMLLRGGSVADAAITALLCMGVIHSQSMGIGGGFLMVMYNGTTHKTKVLNAREIAPAAAFEDMFDGNANKSQVGGLAVGIPGEIRGYWTLHQEHGRLPWKDLFEPAIKLCNDGFKVTHHTANAFNSSKGKIMNEPSLKEIFFNEKTNDVYKEGDIIYRKQLALTFKEIAEKGADEFYTGDIARKLIEDLNRFGGIMTMEDLKNYTAKWVDPIKVEFRRNFTLHAMPPPGSGILMVFMMKILDHYAFNPESIKNTTESVKTYQRITEAFKHAYAKRTHLGDPFDDVKDIVEGVVANLTSDSYVDSIRDLIQDDNTNNTYEYYGAELYQPDDHGTAHISIIDINGDAIAITSTVNLYFGASIRSRQTGVIYNNEMDDFSAPNITNAFGVPPSPNNFIKPGKHPLSSMTPAIITDQTGNVRLTIGTAGGTKITTATTLVAIRNLWFEENIKTAIDAPRIHHQLYPMQLQYEKGFPQNVEKMLKKFGHNTTYLDLAGSVTCGISKYPNGTIIANSDYRKRGTVAGY